jgi:hypothetical protein
MYLKGSGPGCLTACAALWPPVAACGSGLDPPQETFREDWRTWLMDGRRGLEGPPGLLLAGPPPVCLDPNSPGLPSSLLRLQLSQPPLILLGLQLFRPRLGLPRFCSILKQLGHIQCAQLRLCLPPTTTRERPCALPIACFFYVFLSCVP